MRVGVWSSESGQSPAQGKHWEGESTVPGNERVPLHTEVFGVWGCQVQLLLRGSVSCDQARIPPGALRGLDTSQRWYPELLEEAVSKRSC